MRAIPAHLLTFYIYVVFALFASVLAFAFGRHLAVFRLCFRIFPRHCRAGALEMLGTSKGVKEN